MSKVSAQQAVENAQKLIARGSFRQATLITEQIVDAFPKNPIVLHMHAMTLYRRGLYRQTIEQLNHLRACLSQDDERYVKTVVFIAQAQTMLGDLADSVKTLLDAHQESGSDSMDFDIAAELVERYVDLDDQEKAEAILELCDVSTKLSRKVSATLACAWARAVKDVLPIEDQIEQLSIVADGPNASAGLSFALGRLLEKGGRYDESFKRYQQANAFSPPEYQKDRAILRMNQVCQGFTSKLLNSTVRPASDPSLIRPILIVGMPRSGTTLTEQILGAHPLIAAAGESQALPEISRSLTSHPTGEHAQKLQGAYLDELKVSANISEHITACESPPFVTDKNLMNLFLIGLAHAIVPDSIIIYVHRDPRDVCFSCFNSPLANDHNYKFDLSNCAHFAGTVRQTLDHFRPIVQADSRMTWIDLSYEQLTQNPESTITELFESLGLEPHADCFHFHRSGRSVRTISKDQVREPMHTQSIARWEKFAHIPEVQGMLASLRGDGLID